ncbi:hypothetical protein F9K33_10985 [bacterium]|nr:MAG: hypothetical protein F9K33_10985 [bacterium]
MNDTHPEIEKQMLELISAMSPEERLHKTGRLYASGKYFAKLVVKKQQPDLDGIALEIEIFKWMHRSELKELDMAEIENHLLSLSKR